MIKHIRVVTVRVRNQEQALDFYVNTLGLVKRRDSRISPDTRWIEVTPPGSRTGIVLVRHPDPGREGGTGTDTGIVFETDNIQHAYEELRRRGVEFTEEPSLQPWGVIQAEFVDPDGNTLILVQPW